jgi:large subunit ribosomal protein L9
MKVVFLEDVEGVAQGGEVKEVKRGFARNYLIPQSLAMPATRDALQRIDRLSKEAEDQRIKKISDMKELAEELKGKRVNVAMRAGATGRLYGSVTNGIVADALAELMDREIERRDVQIPDSIREVGIYEVRLHLYADINADVEVLVHPMDAEPEEFLQHLADRKAQAEGGGEDEATEDQDLDDEYEAIAGVTERVEAPEDVDEPASETEAEPDEDDGAESA